MDEYTHTHIHTHSLYILLSLSYSVFIQKHNGIMLESFFLTFQDHHDFRLLYLNAVQPTQTTPLPLSVSLSNTHMHLHTFIPERREEQKEKELNPKIDSFRQGSLAKIH